MESITVCLCGGNCLHQRKTPDASQGATGLRLRGSEVDGGSYVAQGEEAGGLDFVVSITTHVPTITVIRNPLQSFQRYWRIITQTEATELNTSGEVFLSNSDSTFPSVMPMGTNIQCTVSQRCRATCCIKCNINCKGRGAI
jgi:hypothetical protein